MEKYVNRPEPQAEAITIPRISDEADLPHQKPTGGDVRMLHRPSTWSAEVEENVPKRLKGKNSITFSDEDIQEVQLPHDDPVVVSAVIANFDVKQILIDNGSSVDVLLYDAFV